MRVGHTYKFHWENHESINYAVSLSPNNALHCCSWPKFSSRWKWGKPKLGGVYPVFVVPRRLSIHPWIHTLLPSTPSVCPAPSPPWARTNTNGREKLKGVQVIPKQQFNDCPTDIICLLVLGSKEPVLNSITHSLIPPHHSINTKRSHVLKEQGTGTHLAQI